MSIIETLSNTACVVENSKTVINGITHWVTELNYDDGYLFSRVGNGCWLDSNDSPVSEALGKFLSSVVFENDPDSKPAKRVQTDVVSTTFQNLLDSKGIMAIDGARGKRLLVAELKDRLTGTKYYVGKSSWSDGRRENSTIVLLEFDEVDDEGLWLLPVKVKSNGSNIVWQNGRQTDGWTKFKKQRQAERGYKASVWALIAALLRPDVVDSEEFANQQLAETASVMDDETEFDDDDDDDVTDDDDDVTDDDGYAKPRK